MKRHPVLAHLSRDHHPALILAQLLKRNAPPYKGMPTDSTSKVEYAMEFYHSDLVSHFDEEEQMMKIASGLDKELDKKIGEIQSEHIQLRKMFTELPAHPVIETAMDELGNALDKHIRKEERELFPLIERYSDEKTMRAIEVLLRR